MKIRFMLFVFIVFLFSACANSIPEQPEEEYFVPLVKEPYFEKNDFFWDDEDVNPDRCFKSYDVDGNVCTVEKWSANLDAICSADKIELKYAETCIWRQFAYCDEFEEYFGTEGETRLIDRNEVYNCTNYLMYRKLNFDSSYNY